MAKPLFLILAAWAATNVATTDRVVVRTTPTRNEPAHAIVQRSDGMVWMMTADNRGQLTDDYQIGKLATLPALLKGQLSKHEAPIHFQQCAFHKSQISIVASATLKSDAQDGSVDRVDRLWFFSPRGKSLGRYSADSVDEVECLQRDGTLYIAVTEGERNTVIRMFRCANGNVVEVPHPHVEVDARETDTLKTNGPPELSIQLEESGGFTDRSGQPKEKRIIRRIYRLSPTGLSWKRHLETVEFQ